MQGGRTQDGRKNADGTRFRDRANFQGEAFAPISAFNHVVFDIPPSFPEPHDDRMFNKLYHTASQYARTAIKRDRHDKEGTARRSLLDRKRTPDQRWAALSGGYRTLKNTARQHGDFFLEQTYYRYETKSRMKRPNVSVWEKIAASIYDLVSDFGNSIARPFAALFTALAISTVAYFTIAQTSQPAAANTAPPIEETAWQSLEFAWNNTFRPFSALSSEPPKPGEASRVSGQLLYQSGGATAALLPAIATLQSLLSLVLAFLFALAVRRRFQIDG